MISATIILFSGLPRYPRAIQFSRSETVTAVSGACQQSKAFPNCLALMDQINDRDGA